MLFFETNQPIGASATAQLLVELENFALQRQYLGADATLEVTELQTGTMWIKVTGILGTLGSAAGMISCYTDVAQALQTPDAPVAQCVATLVERYGVVSTRVVTCNGGVDIAGATMPAVQQRRSNSAGAPEDTRQPLFLPRPSRATALSFLRTNLSADRA